MCYIHRFQEDEACHATRGHTEKHQDWSGGREEGETAANPFIVVSVGRNCEAGKAA